jgi:hypothetical protein
MRKGILLLFCWIPLVLAAQPVAASIGGSTQYNGTTRALNVELNGRIAWDLPFDVRLNAYIVESPMTGMGTGWDQLNGYNNAAGHPLNGLGDPIQGYSHKWVLRDMLGGHHGLPGVVPNPASGGASFQHVFQTSLDPGSDESKVSVVLIVQKHDPDPLKREILNAVHLPLNGSVAAWVAPEILSAGFHVFPNPASDRLLVQLGRYTEWKVGLSDVQGREIRGFEFQGDRGEMMVHDIPPGLYLLQVSGMGAKTETKKVVIR